MFDRWRWVRPEVVEQVANACDDFLDLTPASEAPAAAVRAAWAPLSLGQAVPMVGERVIDNAEPCVRR